MSRWCFYLLLLIDYCYTDHDWWKNSLIYHIYPRSFKDSDGDGVGDIKGIISKLDYLESTGVDAIWLSPIFASPMVDFGYDVSDYKAIDPVFGTMGDFYNLRMITKKKGIKLILDFVPNHSSDQHKWFEKSSLNHTKYKDYYIWANGRVIQETYELLPPNNWLAAKGGSAWKWHMDREQYYLHQYTSGQPDLNYRNQRVRNEMQDVLRFWLEKGVDGFRVDAVSRLFEDKNLNHEKRSDNMDALPGHYNSLNHDLTINHEENHQLVAEWRKLLDEYSQETGRVRILFTECKGDFNQIVSYYGNSTHPEGHFSFNFDLTLKIKNSSNARDFKNVIDKWSTILYKNWQAGNHDQSRVASRLGRNMVDVMNMLVLTLPGIAITYNGEEIGMEDTPVSWEEAKDPRCFEVGRKKCTSHVGTRDPQRTPFQWDGYQYAGFSTNKTWLPVNSNYVELNLRNQINSFKSHYQTYKRLVQARNQPAIKRGNFSISAPNDSILIFTRKLEGSNSFLVVINLGEQLQGVELDVYNELNKDLTVYATSVNSALEIGSVVSGFITLQPKEAVLFETVLHMYPAAINSAFLNFENISFLFILPYFVLSIFIVLFCKLNR